MILFVLCVIPQNTLAQSISELQAQGKDAFRTGNYSLLEDKTREIIKQSPNHRWANLQLGFALRVQGKLEEAIEQYRKTLDFNSTDEWAAYAYNGLGNTLRNLGQLKEAIPVYNKAIELNPNHDYAYRNLGILFNELGQPQEAIKYFEKQLKSKQHKYPRYTHQVLADTLNSIGNKEEAINTYKQALNISITPQDVGVEPTDSYIYMSIAYILMSQDKINEAISYFRQALRLPDDKLSSTTVHALTHTNLGIILLNNNNLSEASIEFQKAIDIDPSYTYAQDNLDKIRQIANQIQRPNNTILTDSKTNLPQEFKASVYEKFYSVVFIEADFCQKTSHGTGWIVKRERNKVFILTNRHVVFDENCSSTKKSKVTVKFFNEQKNNTSSLVRLNGTVVNVSDDDHIDLALIEVTDILDNKYQALKISSKQIGVDEDVRIIGHPVNADPWTTARGYISSINTEKMQIPATLNAGNSGSPVLDLKTLEVVGIIYNVLPATEPTQTSGFGDALPIDIIKEQLSIWGII